MKQSSNNEVDILLRSLARQRRAVGTPNATSAGDGGAGRFEHLDADELNSYAEGVLPAAAHQRYTEHLADCDDCRGLVVGLSQAAGAAIRQPIPGSVGSSFWQKLAALFSPVVIRFAIPALVLTAVTGIGLVAFLQQRRSDFIAKNAPENERIASPPGDSGVLSKELPQSAPQASHPPDTSGTPVDSLKPNIGADVKKNRDVETPPAGPDSEAPKALAAKDDRSAGTGAGLATQPGYALEPKPADAAPPPPASKMGEMAKSAELDRAENAARSETQNRGNYEFKNTPDEHGPSRAAQQNNNVYQARQRVDGSVNRGPSGRDKDKNEKEVESRTVAGRRFVRDGNTWVDTTYDSSRATTRVARGSDQFRALVADEPGIRTIADQLDGVVIVVWKSRAYRIQ